MKINRGMCPLPREARELLGVPLLATQTIYQALNWGERLKNNGLGGGGGGGGGGEWNGTERIYPHFTFD